MGEDFKLSDFTGVARLFPLPNVVMFPHVVLPLHIFEPRYRQMTADAIAGDRLLALVLPRPGWEADYDGKPTIHDTACLVRIMNEQKMPDGKYNILVRGVCRLRLDEEITTDKLYRLAPGWPMPDPTQPEPLNLRARLSHALASWIPAKGPALAQFQLLFESSMPLGVLCDIIGFTLPLPVEVKQQLLEELDPEQRAKRLLAEMTSTKSPPLDTPEGDSDRPRRPFPPEFSLN